MGEGREGRYEAIVDGEIEKECDEKVGKGTSVARKGNTDKTKNR